MLLASEKKSSIRKPSNLINQKATTEDRPTSPLLPPQQDYHSKLQSSSLCPCGGGCPRCKGEENTKGIPLIQSKSRANHNQPNDSVESFYEKEADTFANHIMQMSNDPLSPHIVQLGSMKQLSQIDNIETYTRLNVTNYNTGTKSFTIDHEPNIELNGSKKVYGVNNSDLLPLPESQSILAAKLTPISKTSNTLSKFDDQLLTNLKINTFGGYPLPSSTRSFFEPRFGASLQEVRIHQDIDAANANNTLNSDAFTSGSHIWLSQGMSTSNLPLLAHELAHVLQQQGITNGNTISRDSPLEPAIQFQRRSNVKPMIIEITAYERSKNGATAIVSEGEEGTRQEPI
jgi:hypothetical protein